MGAQILIVLIFRIEPKGTCTKEKKRDNYRERGKRVERKTAMREEAIEIMLIL